MNQMNNYKPIVYQPMQLPVQYLQVQPIPIIIRPLYVQKYQPIYIHTCCRPQSNACRAPAITQQSTLVKSNEINSQCCSCDISKQTSSDTN